MPLGAKRRPSEDVDAAEDEISGDRPSTDPTSSTAKRRRVTLACDGCRAARERCDGQRPACGRCLGFDRPCVYKDNLKKRGVQAGYLRMIEASLQYLLECNPDSEEAVYQLLAAETIAPRSAHCRRFCENWREGRVHREIRRLLNDASDDDESRRDGEDNDPATLANLPLPPRVTTPTSQASNAARAPGAPHAQPLTLVARLPTNWRRLVDIFFTYTHCWFPILDRQPIERAALSVPPEGLAILGPSSSEAAVIPSQYAELWAVLALASFQDTASGLSTGDTAPKEIFSVARSMIPSEENLFELSHIRAMLIHSMVLMGQGAGLASWMVIGTSVRLTLYLRRQTRENEDGHVRSSHALLFGACLVLNTIASACLGQPTFLKADTQFVDSFMDGIGDGEVDERWTPITGFGYGSDAERSTQPLRNFKQLYKLTQLLSIKLEAGDEPGADHAGGATAEDLIRCLEPRFSFCNSLVLGISSIPSVPSAFVIQAVFLTVAVQVVPDYRRSALLSTLTEVLESSTSSFGPQGTPPIISGLLGLLSGRGFVDKMPEADRTKLEAGDKTIRAVWAQRKEPEPWQSFSDDPVDYFLDATLSELLFNGLP